MAVFTEVHERNEVQYDWSKATTSLKTVKINSFTFYTLSVVEVNCMQSLLDLIQRYNSERPSEMSLRKERWHFDLHITNKLYFLLWK